MPLFVSLYSFLVMELTSFLSIVAVLLLFSLSITESTNSALLEIFVILFG